MYMYVCIYTLYVCVYIYTPIYCIYFFPSHECYVSLHFIVTTLLYSVVYGEDC